MRTCCRSQHQKHGASDDTTCGTLSINDLATVTDHNTMYGRIRFAESGFKFVVNLDLDSLANRMVWIRGSCRLEVTSLLFIYVCDTDVTSGFASESTSKQDSLHSRIRIRIRALNARIH